MRISKSNLRALAIACPRCQAPAGHRCRNWNGSEGTGWAHQVRRAAERSLRSEQASNSGTSRATPKLPKPRDNNKAAWIPPASPELLELAKQHEAAGFLPWEGPDCFAIARGAEKAPAGWNKLISNTQTFVGATT